MQDAKILVHGGGKKATAMAKKMDIPVKMVEGRRITDAKISISLPCYMVAKSTRI